MAEWWNGLDMFLKILWLITIPVSTIFFIQMLLTFLGLSSEGIVADFSGDIHSEIDLGGSNDMDLSGGPFQIFTIRNFSTN